MTTDPNDPILNRDHWSKLIALGVPEKAIRNLYNAAIAARSKHDGPAFAQHVLAKCVESNLAKFKGRAQ
jgi:hypothetical protein